MKLALKYWKNITIIFLIVVIVFMRECSPTPNIIRKAPIFLTSKSYTPKITGEDKSFILQLHRTSISSSTDTVYDTLFIHDNGEVDSAKIVEDWLTKRNYNDTLINNDSALAIVSDVVWKNRIYNRSFEFTLYPQNGLKQGFQPQKNKIFVGFGLNGYSNKFGIHGSIALLNKKEHLYVLSYDPINRTVYISLFWKISFHKRP